MIERLSRDIERIGTVWAVIGATLLIILGVIIVLYPVVLAWIVGVLLVLGGITVFGVLLGLVAARVVEEAPAQERERAEHQQAP